MKQDLVEQQVAEVHELGVALLQQAERCAVVGLYTQAEAILCQVWSMVEGQDTHLATTAAWDIAWLLVRRGAYAEAGEWVDRITAPPAIRGQMWPLTRHSFAELCRLAANAPTAAFAPTRPLALPSPRAATELAPLTIVSLGHFQIMRDGVALPLCRSRKAVAILRYLLMQRQHAASKDELMELLWPDLSPRKSAHNLHVAVSALRQYLDPAEGSYLVFEAGRYSLNPDVLITDDCTTFRQLCDEAEQCRRTGDVAAAQHSYMAALACYQGDYDLNEQDYPWTLAERERLLARYLAALEHLGHLLSAQSCFETAAEYFQRLLERDMYREDIHCELMRCYWQLGRRGESLRQYRQCRQMLQQELGLEPSQETQQLYQAIRASE